MPMSKLRMTLLDRLANINSGTHNLEGVRAVTEIMMPN